jgi:hypothetical protein
LGFIDFGEQILPLELSCFSTLPADQEVNGFCKNISFREAKGKLGNTRLWTLGPRGFPKWDTVPKWLNVSGWESGCRGYLVTSMGTLAGNEKSPSPYEFAREKGLLKDELGGI